MDGGPKRAINKMESVLAAASLNNPPPNPTTATPDIRAVVGRRSLRG